MLKMAIKNSLAESKNLVVTTTSSSKNDEDSTKSVKSSPLDDIEEVKIFRPTEEEFKDPMRYIEHLYYKEKANNYGIVKIIPPPGFRPPLAFD